MDVEFCQVCGAIAYLRHLMQTGGDDAAQEQHLALLVARRDTLYDTFVQQQPPGVALPPPTPLDTARPTTVHWGALTPEEQTFAQQSYTQLCAQTIAAPRQPTCLTPWWSAFFFSS